MSYELLVDTSAWILSFKDSGNQKLKDYLREAIDSDRVVTIHIVILELLQGVKIKMDTKHLNLISIYYRFTR